MLLPRGKGTLSYDYMYQMRVTLGAARAQTCARVLRTLDPYLANRLAGENRQLPPVTRGCEKFEASGHKKREGNAPGENKLSPGAFPYLFPVRFAHRFGGFQPPCPKAPVAKPEVSPFPIASAGNPLVRRIKLHPQMRVQGRTADDRLWRESHRR